ncbi:RNA-dependent ATPase [Physocladia obscura]|uniref:RNA helicase n=1 Tax=Physocladia obscura TaxID=109957 RepID=A0AAD5SQH9_9FUNG|nr:RNA-dependent ATPase [Physocladia obscura]
MGSEVELKKSKTKKRRNEDQDTANSDAIITNHKVESAGGASKEKKDKKKKSKKVKTEHTNEDVELVKESSISDATETKTDKSDRKKEKKEKKEKSKPADSGAIRSAIDAAVQSITAKPVGGNLWKYTQSELTKATPTEIVTTFLSDNSISIGNSDDTLKPILDFTHACFPKEITKLLCEFPKPTFIQSVTWPPILTGRDLVGIAATGSGKTIAFGIPAMLYIMNKLASTKVSGSPKRKIQALVMSPTRELAMQIQDTFEKFSKASGLTSICLYGGASKYDQKQLLRSGPDIVVATPGRLMDFMGESECDLTDVGFFVLDEADRMLDLGFEPNIKEIAAAIKNKERQTVMFSATWPQSVMNLSKKYLKNPVHITVGSKDLSANVDIEQRVEVLVDNRAKENRLISLLRDYHKSRKNRIMIFALYKKEAARLEQFVRGLGYNANAIHGDLTQDKRSAAIATFKDGSCPLLIATDVAARGIDIPNVEYVINYTYPLTTEDYCHRIGRTGRAGNKGIAHTFFTALDKAHSGALINVLKQANQKVPDDLMKFGTTVKKKLDSNYGAFTKDIDPNAKATKITFGDDDD